jgi:hypothetical protein
LYRVSELFGAIGTRGPSPSHIMKQKDLDDALWITKEIDERRVDAERPVCGECSKPIKILEPEGWVHEDESAVVRKHDVVPVLGNR